MADRGPAPVRGQRRHNSYIYTRQPIRAIPQPSQIGWFEKSGLAEPIDRTKTMPGLTLAQANMIAETAVPW
jgi:hypothetical protein